MHMEVRENFPALLCHVHAKHRLPKLRRRLVYVPCLGDRHCRRPPPISALWLPAPDALLTRSSRDTTSAAAAWQSSSVKNMTRAPGTPITRCVTLDEMPILENAVVSVERCQFL